MELKPLYDTAHDAAGIFRHQRSDKKLMGSGTDAFSRSYMDEPGVDFLYLGGLQR
jgi:hypothetical protein